MITFNPATPTARVGFPLTVTVYSPTPITGITNLNSDKMTVAGSTGGYSAVLTINVIPPALFAGVIHVSNASESADLTVTLEGITPQFVRGLIGLDSIFVGELCRGIKDGIQKINPWSFWKPVRRLFADQYKKLTDLMVRGAHFGLAPAGFTTEGVNNDYSQGIIYTGLAPWTYENVTGGANQVCTLDDFAGYNPSALPPITPTKEYFWNTAETEVCPVIKAAFKVAPSESYQGGLTATEYANIQVEAKEVIPNPTEQHLCVMMQTVDQTPYFLVANASHPLWQGGVNPDTSKAGIIDVKKFTIFEILRRYEDYTNNIHGLRHRMKLGLNRIEQTLQRPVGHVFQDDDYDVTTAGQFTAEGDSSLYVKKNGYHNNAFTNPPEGETFIDLYTYYLLSWMYGLTTNLKLTYAQRWQYPAVIDLPASGISMTDSALDAIEAAYDGYIDVEFSAMVYNSGASMIIAGKTVTSGMGTAPITIDLLNNAYFDIFRNGASESDWIRATMPIGYAWYKNGVTVYTEVERPTINYESSNKLYIPNETFPVAPSAVAGDYSTVTYNSVVYDRYPVGDVKNYPIYTGGTAGYGIRPNGNGLFNTSLEIAQGANVLVDFRLRACKASVPAVFGYDANDGIVKIIMGYGLGNPPIDPQSPNAYPYSRT